MLLLIIFYSWDEARLSSPKSHSSKWQSQAPKQGPYQDQVKYLTDVQLDCGGGGWGTIGVLIAERVPGWQMRDWGPESGRPIVKGHSKLMTELLQDPTAPRCRTGCSIKRNWAGHPGSHRFGHQAELGLNPGSASSQLCNCGKSLHLSEPWGPHMSNGENNSTYPMRLLLQLRERILVKQRSQIGSPQVDRLWHSQCLKNEPTFKSNEIRDLQSWKVRFIPSVSGTRPWCLLSWLQHYVGGLAKGTRQEK